MNKNYQVRNMTRDEMDIAIEWAANEGWNPGLYDAECFYYTDPKGFFVGVLDDEIISLGSAVCYDEQFAFCGFYIVKPAFRGQGYGLELTKARLNYAGDRNVGIDGVVEMLDKYERLGYRIAHQNARYQGMLSTANNIHEAIRPIIAQDRMQLNQYDRTQFPAPRATFLNDWTTQPESQALIWHENGEIKGYGVIRKCIEGYKIGPLFANTPMIAEQILLALARFGIGKNIYLDIAENNPEAIALVKRFGMEKVFKTARMYLKGPPKINHDRVYGITTFELG